MRDDRSSLAEKEGYSEHILSELAAQHPKPFLFGKESLCWVPAGKCLISHCWLEVERTRLWFGTLKLHVWGQGYRGVLARFSWMPKSLESPILPKSSSIHSAGHTIKPRKAPSPTLDRVFFCFPPHIQPSRARGWGNSLKGAHRPRAPSEL